MKISVFITSYNQKQYLVEAIDSVLNQTLQPFEIIVVDDCSTDGSQDVIRHYAEQYPDLIRPFCHPQNLGIAKNKAFAQQQVQGDWLTYLDGDDRFLPEKLQAEANLLQQHPEARIAFSNFEVINAKGKRLHSWATESDSVPSGYIFPQVFSREFPRNTLFRNELVAYDCLKQVGFYDESRKTHEDWDLKIRLTQQFSAVYCPIPLIEYRRHGQSISKSLVGMTRFQEMQEVYRKNQPLLKHLSPPEQAAVEAKLSDFFAMKAHQIVRDAVRHGPRRQAFQWYFKLMKWMPFDVAIKTFGDLFLPYGWAK